MTAVPSLQAAKKGASKLWVPLVLVIGAFLGVVFSTLIPLPYGYGPFGPQLDELRNLLVVHTILSTLIITLQVALVIVYLRVYADTGARFALGILVVMAALLLQSFFQSPLVLGFVGRFTEQFGPYLSLGDLFTVAAYTIFLYLSLE